MTTLSIPSSELSGLLELVETLKPGLDMTAEKAMVKGLTMTPATVISKQLADGTMLQLNLEITPDATPVS